MRIYVGNLPYETTDTDIKQLFGKLGDVGDVVFPIDRETGRPKGFAFVEMANASEANNVIATLNNSMMGSRTITVNEARPKAPREGGGGNFGGGGRSDRSDKRDRDDRRRR